MGATYWFAFPFPEPGASVDVPRDVKNLGEEVDKILHDKFVQYGVDGSVVIVGGGVARPLPFATAAGSVRGNTVGGPSAAVFITFPVGRFTVQPAISVTPYDPNYYGAFTDCTPTGCRVWAVHGESVSVLVEPWIVWVALQVGPTTIGASTMEIQTDGELTHMTVTCHTGGCENAGHAIDISMVEPGETPIVCGVCTEPITDVVPI